MPSVSMKKVVNLNAKAAWADHSSYNLDGDDVYGSFKLQALPETTLRDGGLPGHQTKLIIDFLIIGAGVSGLSCAIALRRAGHRVVVVEREKEIGQSDVGRGVRLPPNLSKILYRWNLKSEVSAFAAKSKQIRIYRLDTGDRLGDHYWDDEVLRETQREFLFGHLADLRKMMYAVAVDQGATVRLATTAVSVDPERHAVTLGSGETLTADVVIGADGAFGLVRPMLLNEEGIQEATKPTMCMYSATAPKALVEKDPQSKHFYEHEVVRACGN
ncbi:hypothetical protein R3P38DRAFT_3299854 [Favolaschia claudopus]|uniref:FAD-binding domain-containing protein n=1 Tax=Favolaschia claudopus TaxID=2862362 RepID=A0AAV9YZ62_9AGAR